MKSLFIAFGIVLIASTVWALRASRPLTLSYPISQDQVSQLNKYLEDIWNMQSGRFELDIVTSPKTNAKNGEIWILTGPTAKFQFKVDGNVYSINTD